MRYEAVMCLYYHSCASFNFHTALELHVELISPMWKCEGKERQIAEVGIKTEGHLRAVRHQEDLHMYYRSQWLFTCCAELPLANHCLPAGTPITNRELYQWPVKQRGACLSTPLFPHQFSSDFSDSHVEIFLTNENRGKMISDAPVNTIDLLLKQLFYPKSFDFEKKNLLFNCANIFLIYKY